MHSAKLCVFLYEDESEVLALPHFNRGSVGVPAIANSVPSATSPPALVLRVLPPKHAQGEMHEAELPFSFHNSLTKQLYIACVAASERSERSLPRLWGGYPVIHDRHVFVSTWKARARTAVFLQDILVFI